VLCGKHIFHTQLFEWTHCNNGLVNRKYKIRLIPGVNREASQQAFFAIFRLLLGKKALKENELPKLYEDNKNNHVRRKSK